MTSVAMLIIPEKNCLSAWSKGEIGRDYCRMVELFRLAKTFEMIKFNLNLTLPNAVVHFIF